MAHPCGFMMASAGSGDHSAPLPSSRSAASSTGGSNTHGGSTVNSPLASSLTAKRLRELTSTSVHFRDMEFLAHPSAPDSPDASGGNYTVGEEERLAALDFTALGTPAKSGEYVDGFSGTIVKKNKLIIVMVGLPGRGKTFLCNKLMCYLNWLGHATRHFNVGQYRRKQRGSDEVQDASFFDHSNLTGVEARNRALDGALDDMARWLKSDQGQVAIFDATNTTEQRRQLLRGRFHGVWQYMFIEMVCTDKAVLEANYRNKMQYSPDYQGVDTEQAVADFLARIRKYEEVYEPITNRDLHYIRLTDMITGRGHMDINRISGYIPGKIVFFLMQVCKAGLSSVRKIWLSRHGESQFNERGLIGGDSDLSARGERYAQALPDVLISRLHALREEPAVSVAVWTSTLKRTIRTARHLPFPKLRWKALDEINAGICDGLTYEDIAKLHPREYAARKQDKLRYRYPAGESYLDVIQRVEPVVIEMERERECICVVAHQAVLRAVYAYFMGVPQEEIPRLDMPLHTLIELTPMPDGTMHELRYPVDIDAPHLLPDKATGVQQDAAAAVGGSERSGAPSRLASGGSMGGGLGGNACRQDLASTVAGISLACQQHVAAAACVAAPAAAASVPAV